MQVPAGTVEAHTLICKDLDRAVNAADGLNERLQRLADCCESSSREELSPIHQALLLRLAHHCTSASLVPTNPAVYPTRACQVGHVWPKGAQTLTNQTPSSLTIRGLCSL